MARLFVAASGGGDAVAAAMLHRALGGSRPAHIATYAWDRPVVGPRPGPRAADDFDGLVPLAGGAHVVGPGTRSRTPDLSTLPRLAGDLRDTLALLDPTGGAVGLRRQVAALVSSLRPDGVSVVDVGGDVVARGDEPGVPCSLADGLALAACTGLVVPVTVLVAGPGLDGEMAEADVVRAIDRPPVFRLRSDDVALFRGVLDWHPSEPTALLAAAALGRRGRVEVREGGPAVTLTDRSTAVYALPLGDALAANRLAGALADTTTLADAEQVTRKACGSCEVEEEHSHEAGPPPDLPVAMTAEVDAAVRLFEDDAAGRGVDYVTFRRLAEVASLAPTAAVALRHHLVSSRPDRLAWPLWSVTARPRPPRPRPADGR